MDIIEKAANAAKSIEADANGAIEIAKAKAKLCDEQSKLSALKGELGDKYWGIILASGGSIKPEAGLEDVCARIQTVSATISMYESDIERLKKAEEERKAAAKAASEAQPKAGRACPKCQTALPADARFCPECGSPIPVAPPAAAKRFCTNCGTSLAPDARFCPECGAKA